MNGVVFALVAILCLLSVSSIVGLVQVVKAEGGTITINADGSISPSTAPIYTADNVTYTLTGNINITSVTDGIDIERNNIVLNGAGYTVQGVGSSSIFVALIVGISLNGTSNDAVENVNVNGFGYGIELYSCYANNSITGNNLTNNAYGIYCMEFANGNSITGNNVINSVYSGIFLLHASNDSITGNNISATEWVGITLMSSQYNAIMGNNITNNQIGIGTECGNEGDPVPLSSDNNIYLNNFINNSEQVNMTIVWYDSSVTGLTPNNWDNGTYGNNWSDYNTKYPNATETDGVWNTPYVIDANNTDYYPLTVPYPVIPEFPSIQATMLFMLLTLLAVIIYKKKAISYKRL